MVAEGLFRMNRSVRQRLPRLLAVIATVSLLVALMLSCSHLLTQAAAQAAQGTATPAASPEAANPANKVWFVIAPAGKANGDYFDVKLDAGKSATVNATIGNGSAIPVKAILYAADAHSDVNGGFILNDSTEQTTAPTTWLDFPTTTREFKPQEAIQTSFTVSVPAGTPPGQYITGIAVETADAAPMPGNAPLLVKYRLMAAVLITVPGTVTPGFSLGDVSIATDGQTSTISGAISNTGNIRVRPEGKLTVTDASGAAVVSSPITMSSVYAGDKTTWQVIVPSPLPEGEYTVNVELKDPDTGATASVHDGKVAVAKPEAPAPVTVASASFTPMPSTTNVVFVQASITIANTAEPRNGVNVTLRVLKDGKQVDEQVLATAMTLQNGNSTIDQSYIPKSGKWESGTYTFEVTVTATDQHGASSTIASFTSNETIVIP
jgi:hypothetical protein